MELLVVSLVGISLYIGAQLNKLYIIKEQMRKLECEREMIIAKVRFNKASKHKLLTVPKNSNLQVGDYVQLVKLEDAKN